jgi:glycosyltransferase involved in cell wall biosynthesis
VCQKPQCLACSLAYKRPPQLWRYTEKLADAVRNIDVFLALNRFSMEMHQQWGFQSPMQVLSPFVPRSSWTGETAASSGKQYFLFVGRLERLKGLHTVLPLFEGFGETELWIAGDGSEREALEKQASGNKRVRFLGRLNETQLTQLYRQALAVVVPSLSYEMFGLIVLEAFREGTPAVVARIGGLTEIVESSGGGFAYSSPEELAMRLRELEKNPELRERMGRRGLAAFEERWTPEAHLTQYFSIIQGIAQSRP